MNKGIHNNHTSTYDFRRTETFSITKFRLTNTSNQYYTSALRICNKFPAYLFNLSLSDVSLCGSFKRRSIVLRNFMT
ncbi:hypothetical protein C0J52_07421 [Blattella germanica]|nr:hypothetical protein C0J52_07421 [Blattella germanica]